MEMRNLGATGMKVTSLCLGTMMFGPMGNNDQDDCVRIIHRALDAGINFLDTADVYSQGVSEQIVGAALKGRREHAIVATKFFHPMGEDPQPGAAARGGGSCRRSTTASTASGSIISTSTRCTAATAATDLDDTLFALTELVRQGKIRTFGSSMLPGRPDRGGAMGRRPARAPAVPLRAEHLFDVQPRHRALRVLPACQRHGMGMIVWSPLDGGFLSGKYRASKDCRRQQQDRELFQAHLPAGSMRSRR